MSQNSKDRSGPFEQMGEAVGGFAGKAAGRAGDMAMDVGSSIIGSAANLLGSWWSSAEASQAARSFGEQEDRNCREHFESAGSSETAPRREYERARPVYQFGHVAGQNPEYQGRSFREVEPDLERAWAKAGDERFGEWPEVRGYADFGFSQRRDPDITRAG